VAAAKRSQHLAEAIETRRRELGLSPTDLAEATGVTPEALRNLRRGDVRRYQERLTGPVTRVLGLVPDAIERLLAGEPLSVLVDANRLPAPAADTPTSRVDDAARIERAQIRAQLLDLGRVVDLVAEQVEGLAESVAGLVRIADLESSQRQEFAGEFAALVRRVDGLAARRIRRAP
jgi:transcriptional regulator with XRE-family HTH domain